jgi:hypothetical protein
VFVHSVSLLIVDINVLFYIVARTHPLECLIVKME